MMIQLNPDTEAALKNMAAVDNRSPDDIVNDLITRESHSWQEAINPALLAELDRQKAQLRSSDMVHTWENVRPWIKNWLIDEEQADPEKCPNW